MIEGVDRVIMITTAQIREWITFAADICVLLITIYTFYKTFLCSKVDIVSCGSSLSDDGECNRILILNRKMNPIVVLKVQYIIDNKYIFEISKQVNTIPGLGTQMISTENYGFREPDISLNSDKRIVVITLHPNKKVFLGSPSRFLYYLFPHKIDKLRHITKVSHYFNGKLVPSKAKFAIVYNEKNCADINTGFVYESGMFSDSKMGNLALPKEATTDRAALESFLHGIFNLNEIEYQVYEIRRE